MDFSVLREKITVDGFDNHSDQAKRRLGYVPEVPALYPMLTVYEHLEFIAKAYRLKDWESYAEELLGRFELTDKKNKLGKELSKGMQQKVSVCCAALPRPDVVILDEPLVGLDPHGIREIKHMIADLKKGRLRASGQYSYDRQCGRGLGYDLHYEGRKDRRAVPQGRIIR